MEYVFILLAWSAVIAVLFGVFGYLVERFMRITTHKENHNDSHRPS